MKKPVKILLILLCIFLILLVILPGGVLLYLNTSHAAHLIQNLINKNIPGSLTWQKHHMSIIKGEFDIRKLALQGASGDTIASLDRLYCNLSMASLLKREVRITAFYCDNPWIALQTDSTGLLNVVSAFSSGDTTQKKNVKKDTGHTQLNFHVDSLWFGRAAVSFTAGDDKFLLAAEGVELSAQGDLLRQSVSFSIGVRNAIIRGQGSALALHDFIASASLEKEKVESLTVSVSSPGSHISLQGSGVHIFSDPQVTLELSVRCALKELSDFFQLKPKMNGTVDMQLSAQGTPKNPDAQLWLDYKGGELAGCEVNSVKLDCSVKDRYGSIDTLHITGASGAVDLNGKIDMTTAFPNGYLDSIRNMDAMSYLAELHMDRIKLSEISWIPNKISGVASSHAKVAGTGISPRFMTADAQLSLDIDNLLTKGMPSPLDVALYTEALFTDGIAVVKKASVKTSVTQMSAHGTYDFNHRYVDASLEIDTTDLAALFPLFNIDSVTGFAALTADIKGHVQNPSANCHMKGYDCAFLSYPIGAFDVNASLNEEGTITLSKFSLTNKNSTLTLSGSAGLFKTGSMQVRKDPSFEVVIDKSQLFLQDFMDSLQGEVSIDAQVHGMLSALYGSVVLFGSDFDLGVQKLHSLTLKAGIDSQRVIFEPLEIAITPEEKIQACGWIGFDKRYDLSCTASGISLTSFDKVSDLKMVDGVLNIDFTGKGTLDTPTVSGTFSLNRVQVQQKPLEDIVLSINLRDQVAQISGNLNFDLQGWYHLTEKNFQATTTFNRTSLSPYFILADQKDLHGSITGTITASGNINRMETLNVNAAISDLTIHHKDLQAITTQNLNAVLEGNHLELPTVHISLLNEGNIDISGGGDLDGIVDFTVNANIPVHLASIFSADFSDADGTVEIQGVLKGSIKDPDLKAVVVLKDISLTVPALLQKMHGLSGELVVTPKKVAIDSLYGQLDDGHFDCAGSITLDSLKPTDYAITLHANTLPLNVPDMLSILMNANLTLQGSKDSSAIEGDIEILEGTYYKDVKILSGFGKKKREVKPVAKSDEQSYFNNLKFDVLIKARENFIVDNNLAQLGIDPDLRLVGPVNNLVINGRAKVVSGTLTYLRNTFAVKRGVIDFLDPYKIDPIVDIQGRAQKRQWKITLSTSGSLDDLVFTLSSEPQLEHEDIISLLAVGKTTYELSRGEVTSSATTEQLLAQMIDATLSKEIKNATGLDVFAIETGAEDETEESDRIKLTVGKALSKRLMTKLSIESEKGELTQRAIVEYKIIENILLQTYNDTKGNFGGEVQFKWEFR